MDVLFHYQKQGKYHLHGFVIMHHGKSFSFADHTDIKGSFAYRAKKQLRLVGEIWQASFQDRRVRGAEE